MMGMNVSGAVPSGRELTAPETVYLIQHAEEAKALFKAHAEAEDARSAVLLELEQMRKDGAAVLAKAKDDAEATRKVAEKIRADAQAVRDSADRYLSDRRGEAAKILSEAQATLASAKDDAAKAAKLKAAAEAGNEEANKRQIAADARQRLLNHRLALITSAASAQIE